MSASNVLKTSVGACYPGSHAIFRGHDLHKELEDLSWVELYVFGITGRRLSPQHVELLNRVWTFTSYPDARIWNNRVAALAGKTQSTGMLGLSAAMAVSEAKIYGKGTHTFATAFLIRVKEKLTHDHANLESLLGAELKEFHRILGYGRPIAALQVDERIPNILSYMDKIGVSQGNYLRLAFEIEKCFFKMGKKLVANYAIAAAAIMLDMGFSAAESDFCMNLYFVAGMLPCFIEHAVKNDQRELFSLTCADILYDGHERRVWKERTPRPC